MPNDLMLTLTGALVAALVLGLAAQRFGLSPIVGYVAAGIVVGPFTPGYVASTAIADELAELGVVLLMFGVGLHFRVGELWAVRAVAIPGALSQIAAAIAIGAACAPWFDARSSAGAIFGIALVVASTVVLTRMLGEHGALHTPAGHVAVGWLIVEDLVTVIVLVLMPALQQGAGQSVATIAIGIVLAILKLAVLVAFTLVVGQRALPWLLTRVAASRSRELFTLSVLAIALGIAAGSSVVFGASTALGAFLAGLVIGQSEFGTRAASDALPMRDAFAVLFFVSVGMLLDPAALVANATPIALTLAVVLLVKPAAAYVTVRLLRRPRRTAFTVGLARAQIGEFSFIVAMLGARLELLSSTATQILVAVAIISIALNPIAFRFLLPRLLARWDEPERGELEAGTPDAHHVIVIGYGPVGRTLTRLLRESGISPTVIELNLDSVRSLRREGVHAVYGDATKLDVLEQAGVKTARGLVFAASGTPPDAVVHASRALNPALHVIARAALLRDADAARRAGANVIVTAEIEVALAMTEILLQRLGATPEQLDRTREATRAALTSEATRPDRTAAQ